MLQSSGLNAGINFKHSKAGTCKTLTGIPVQTGLKVNTQSIPVTQKPHTWKHYCQKNLWARLRCTLTLFYYFSVSPLLSFFPSFPTLCVPSACPFFCLYFSCTCPLYCCPLLSFPLWVIEETSHSPLSSILVSAVAWRLPLPVNNTQVRNHRTRWSCPSHLCQSHENNMTESHWCIIKLHKGVFQ